MGKGRGALVAALLLSLVAPGAFTQSAQASQGQAVQVAPGDVDLSDVAFGDARHGWAVAGRFGFTPNPNVRAGLIYATTDAGATWTAQRSGVTTDLFGVDFVDARNGWAVGKRDVVLRTRDGGATWTRTTTGTGADLMDVDFVDANTGWAVGFSLTAGQVVAVTRDGGATWLRQLAADGLTLNALSFSDENHGFAVGPAGTAYRTDNGGLTWLRMLVTGDVPLTATLRLSPLEGLITTNRGEIYRTQDGGVTWGLSARFTSALYGMGHHRGTVIAAGDGGLTVLSGDRGQTWTTEVSGVTTQLRAVALPSTDLAVAVGIRGVGARLDFAATYVPAGPVDTSQPIDTCTDAGLLAAQPRGFNPNLVRSGDVDGDGNQTVVAGGLGGVHAVRPFQPAGEAVRWRLPLPARVRDIAFAELDGNPGREVIVATARSLPEREGLIALDGATGTILWTAQIPQGIVRVAAVDLTGDGVDELVATGPGKTLYVVRGTDGTPHHRPRALGAVAADVAIAPVNDDAVPDIAVALEDGRVLVFDGADGAPLLSFAAVDGDFGGVAIGDVTGDGVPEIVVAGYGQRASLKDHSSDGTSSPGGTVGGLIVVLDRQGRRLWDYGQTGRLKFHAVALGDMTGDGAADVVAYGSRIDRGHVLALDGVGEVIHGTRTGEAVVLWAYDTTRPAPTGMHFLSSPDVLNVVDGNGDGVVDVFVGVTHGGLYALSGKGPYQRSGLIGVARPAVLWTAQRESFVRAVAPVVGEHVRILTGASDGHVALRTADTGAIEWAHDVGGRVELSAGDLDADGLQELAVVTHAGRMHGVDGDTTALASSTSFLPLNGTAAATVDADGDGDADIIGGSADGAVRAVDARTQEQLWSVSMDRAVGALAASASVVATGTRDGRLLGLDATTGQTLWQMTVSSNGRSVTSITYAPLADLFVVGTTDGTVQTVTTAGTTVATTRFTGSVTDTAVADVDGDGREEFVVAGIGGVQLLRADGTRLWTYPLAPGVGFVAVGDLDGDGGADVIAAGLEGHTYGLAGRTGTRMWSWETLYSGGVAALDIDGDGTDEAVVTSTDLVWQTDLSIIDEHGQRRASCLLHTPVSTVAPVDVDGDGYDEVALGDIGGRISLLGPAARRQPPGPVATELRFTDTSARSGQYSDAVDVAARLVDVAARRSRA